MRGIKKLRNLFENFASDEHFLFCIDDLASVFPELSRAALKMLLARAVKDDILKPVCRGIYLYEKAAYQKGLELYHIASKLRSDTFTYISLESALSDAGVISQIPIQWITLMTGGRSGKIDCGALGTIEFVHTQRTPIQLADFLIYDKRCRLWRASVALAVRDMKACKRSLDLIDWSMVDEPI